MAALGARGPRAAASGALTDSEVPRLPLAAPYDVAMLNETQSAGEVYEVHLETPTQPAGIARSVLRGAAALAHQLVGDSLHPSAGDLVVRRRADESEVMRLDAGDGEQAAYLVDHVKTQLAELTAAEFEDAWTLGGPGATGAAAS